MSEIFAKRLKAERELRGWTQQHMAKLLGITNGTLSGYERNYREPDFETLSKISSLLNVSTDYLLGLSSLKRYDLPEEVIEDLLKFVTDNKENGLSPEKAREIYEAIPLEKRKTLLNKFIHHIEEDGDRITVFYKVENDTTDLDYVLREPTTTYMGKPIDECHREEIRKALENVNAAAHAKGKFEPTDELINIVMDALDKAKEIQEKRAKGGDTKE